MELNSLKIDNQTRFRIGIQFQFSQIPSNSVKQTTHYCQCTTFLYMSPGYVSQNSFFFLRILEHKKELNQNDA